MSNCCKGSWFSKNNNNNKKSNFQLKILNLGIFVIVPSKFLIIQNSQNIAGTLLKQFQNNGGTLQEHYGNITTKMKEHFWYSSRKYVEHCWNIAGTFPEHSRNVVRNLLGCWSKIFETFPKHLLEFLQGICCRFARTLQEHCKKIAGRSMCSP